GGGGGGPGPARGGGGGGAACGGVVGLMGGGAPPMPSARLSASEMLPRVAADRMTEPRRLIAQVRGELDWIVGKCLEKERSRRYETAAALAMDLQRHLANEPVVAGPPSATYRVPEFLRRNPRPRLAAGGLGATLGVGGG